MTPKIIYLHRYRQKNSEPTIYGYSKRWAEARDRDSDIKYTLSTEVDELVEALDLVDAFLHNGQIPMARETAQKALAQYHKE